MRCLVSFRLARGIPGNLYFWNAGQSPYFRSGLAGIAAAGDPAVVRCQAPSCIHDPTRRPLPGLARPGSGLPATGRGDPCSASRQRGRPAETPVLHPAGRRPAGTDQGP